MSLASLNALEKIILGELAQLVEHVNSRFHILFGNKPIEIGYQPFKLVVRGSNPLLPTLIAYDKVVLTHSKRAR